MESRDLLPNNALLHEDEIVNLQRSIEPIFRSLFEKGYSRPEILSEITNCIFTEVNAVTLKMRLERAQQK